MTPLTLLMFALVVQIGALLIVLSIIAAKLHNINETIKQVELSVRGRQ